MNIYFAGAIRGGRTLQPVYEAIVKHIQQSGHTVLTEVVASKTLEQDERDMTDETIYTQDVTWLNSCDVMIAEVTVPSLGVGYEIAYALHSTNTPVLCLCQHRTRLSAMLTGNTAPGLTISFYRDTTDALQTITYFLAQRA